MIVESHPFKELRRHVLSEALRQHDGTKFLAFGLSADHHGDDQIDNLVDPHNATLTRRLGCGIGQDFLGHQVVSEVFDRKNQAGLAGDGRAIR